MSDQLTQTRFLPTMFKHIFSHAMPCNLQSKERTIRCMEDKASTRITVWELLKELMASGIVVTVK